MSLVLLRPCSPPKAHLCTSPPLLQRQRRWKWGAPTVASSPGAPDVVLTRELGKNGELEARLRERGFITLELPLVETAAGPDREALAPVLVKQHFSWITITSPEAASVFLEAWKTAGQPEVRIAVVGQGTGKVLAPASLHAAFTPSKANAVTLAAELPLDTPQATVLYPASAKAAGDLQEGLAQRGFTVTRLSTYDTLPVQQLDPQALALAKQARVVAIASPSAVHAWVGFAGREHAQTQAIACIGSTSARAAKKLGMQLVYAPEKPGLEGFTSAISSALQEHRAAASSA